MKNLFKHLNLIAISLTIISNTASAQIWNAPDPNGTVTTNTTVAPVVKNVVIGPTPPATAPTSTNLYLNSTATQTTTFSIDNNYPGTYAPHTSVISFNSWNMPQYKIYMSQNPNCSDGMLHMNHASGGPGMHIGSNSLIFSSQPDYLVCNMNYSNMSVPYLFDGTTYFNNKVLIGTTNTTPTNAYKLYVGGTAICEELIVKLQASWGDYVFLLNTN